MIPSGLKPSLLLFALACLPAEAETRTVPIPRGTLSVEVRGAGARTLVFLHGNGAAKNQWNAQLDAFAKDHRVVAVDLPGMGASAPPARGGYGVEEVAADVWAGLATQPGERLVLVAHSYGGAVALTLAAAHPEAVEGVFLLDVAGDVRAATAEGRARIKAALESAEKDAPRFARLKERMFEPILKDALPATRAKVMGDLEATSVAAFLGCLAGLQEFDPGAALARIRGPVFNLASERMDPAATLAAGHREVAASLLPGTSHWPMLDKPAAVNAALARFLGGILPEQRQFDFWIGDWRVEDEKGQHLGDNLVTSSLGGAVLQEHWRGSRGGVGTSLNAWIPALNGWRQTWIDGQGGLLVLEGGLKGGAMVMEGEQPSPKGPVKSRITWTPLPDGRVRRIWEQSTDGGKTWQMAFDGYYKRKS